MLTFIALNLNVPKIISLLFSTIGFYHAAVALKEVAPYFDFQTGLYVVSVLVADSIAQLPIEWDLGTIFLTFQAREMQHYQLYARSLLHDSDNTLMALPEITHKMRPPAKRARCDMLLRKCMQYIVCKQYMC